MTHSSLAAALTALEAAARGAGIDPDAARAEGTALAAAVAESAPGAFVDWSREVGLPQEDASAFMEASSRGRRFRSTPTPLVTQLRAERPEQATAYAQALADVCSAACLLGTATPQVAGAATMASAAQFAVGQYGATPPVTTTAPTNAAADATPAAGTTPLAEQESFLAKAPAILSHVLGQLRTAQQNILNGGLDLSGMTPPAATPGAFDLTGLDPHAPGAFDLASPGAPVAPVAPAAPVAPTTPVTPCAEADPDPDPSTAAAAAPTTGTEAKAATATEAAPEPEKTVEELLAELDSLVGLARVKTEIRRQSAILRVEGMRKKEGLKSPTITRHLVFVGNPGTGKTTVARLVAGIYKALGLLSKGQLVEVDRSELVAGYLGQTAMKTADVVAKAVGGVLFIDEAYSLNGDQYGEECINTLVKEMEDKRDDLVVIVAGYPLPMAEFIANNPGLNSRFRTTIEFDDYSDDELWGILQGMARSADYDLGDGVEEKFRSLLARQVRDFSFGNGRFARNAMEAAVGRQAWRLREVEEPTLEQLRALLPEDFEEDPAATVEWPPAGTLDIATAQADEAAEDAFDTESPAVDPDEDAPHGDEDAR